MDEPVVDVNLYVGHLNPYKSDCEPIALQDNALMLYDPYDEGQKTWLACKEALYLSEWR